MRCGLLGREAGQSCLPELHTLLGDPGYARFDVTEAELPAFLEGGDWTGLDVAEPLQAAVLPFCGSLGERARRTGCVDTLIRRDGRIFGDNAGAAGFRALAERSGLSFGGKRALVLGDGGASPAVCAALEELGALPEAVRPHSGDPARRADVRFLVSAVPPGTYPEDEAGPLDPARCPGCEAVFELACNPVRSTLLLRAEALGIPCFGGLRVSAARAARSSELFTGVPVPWEAVERIARRLTRERENVVLIGMPGCGKSTLASLLGKATGRKALDADELIAARAGRSIPEIFAAEGEAGFRRRETAVLRELGRLSGKIIATGGGCVTREENYPLLRRRGRILWIRRDAAKLPAEGRPLSLSGDLAAMEKAREPLYRRFADGEIDNNGSPEEALRQLLAAMG